MAGLGGNPDFTGIVASVVAGKVIRAPHGRRRGDHGICTTGVLESAKLPKLFRFLQPATPNAWLLVHYVRQPSQQTLA